ncbi:hypothetical protein FBU30_011019 [Linnemannia zychae]|nr:hypothetical protein FBU30_011019 [Linnemannia zychae]
MSFTFNSNNNGGINNNNSRSSHSVETIKKFRDSIRGITKLSFLSSRSEVHSKNCASVVPEKDAVTIKNASVIRRSTLDCSNISPIVPSPSEFASLDSKSSPVVLSDASSQDKEQSFENLIQLVGNLAREVELMKQQQHLLQQQQPYSGQHY